MTLIELKKSIHEKVDGLNDRELLEIIEEIANRKDEVFIIPDQMKEGVRKGMDDIKHDRVHTMEDFDKKYEKWLKE